MRQEKLGIDGLFTCFGLHPWWVAEHDEEACEAALVLLEEMLPRAWGLGELGLDFLPRFSKSSFPRQRDFFIRQLALAARTEKPIVLHIVRGHGEAPDMIAKAGEFKGLVHGFSGSYETAKRYLDLGLLLSVGGNVTREGYGKLKNAISRLPISQIIIESDAPDMVPVGFQQAFNEPVSLSITAEAVGALMGISPWRVLEQSRENLTRYFGMELK